MAPKLAGKAAKEGETQDGARRSALRKRAITLGLLAKEQPRVLSEPLQPSKALLKCDGKDIIKKSTVRKNRYLVILNCQLAPAAAGRLGTLAQLDTPEPVMYIEFPKGRLKLFGTLMFPRNKYMLLRLGAQAGVMCEDVFETMVVFSEAWWVGSAEENPDEERLPLPPELHTAKLHASGAYAFDHGASAGTGGTGKVEAAYSDSPPLTLDGEPCAAAVAGARRPRRAVARATYVDLVGDSEGGEDGSGSLSSGGSDGSDGDGSGSDVPGSRGGSQAGHGRAVAAPGSARTIRVVRSSVRPMALRGCDDGSREGGGSGDEEQGAAQLPASQPRMAAAQRRPAPPSAKRKRKATVSSDEEEEQSTTEVDAEEEVEEEGGVMSSGTSQSEAASDSEDATDDSPLAPRGPAKLQMTTGARGRAGAEAPSRPGRKRARPGNAAGAEVMELDDSDEGKLPAPSAKNRAALPARPAVRTVGRGKHVVESDDGSADEDGQPRGTLSDASVEEVSSGEGDSDFAASPARRRRPSTSQKPARGGRGPAGGKAASGRPAPNGKAHMVAPIQLDTTGSDSD